MATRAAHKRLTREYQNIQKSPPQYIVAHPSESDILEWHYILTGPPDTPYADGQYWGTLKFPPEYPFAPPAIRMHTPSGRFRCSERLCLSISDYHPKSFNPAWEVSTILLGVLSFMTSEETTLGSIVHTAAERKVYAQQSRWWNSTGGGSTERALQSQVGRNGGAGAIKSGDGGKKFRTEWPELDEENWKWMEKEQIDPKSGKRLKSEPQSSCAPGAAVLIKGASSGASLGAAVEGGQAARDAGQSWLQRNKLYLIGGFIFTYVLAARLLRDP